MQLQGRESGCEKRGLGLGEGRKGLLVESPIELGIGVPQLVSGPCPTLSGPPPLVESHSHSKTQAFTTVPFPHGLGRRPVTAALQPWAAYGVLQSP